MKPDHIDGVPITKPCTDHDRGYIKGWEARQGEIDKLKRKINRIKRLRKRYADNSSCLFTMKFAADDIAKALTGKE